MTRWRVPIDVIAFAIIALVLIAIRLATVRHGLSFAEPSWYFHFGSRVLAGDVPYQDFAFPFGPLPLYVEASAQQLFGARYTASLFAALAIHIARVTVIWMLARRLASWQPAVAVTVFCALDPLVGFAHHWHTAYLQLLITTSALCLAVAHHTDRLHWFALAGGAAALVLAVAPTAAVVIGVVLAVTSAICLTRRRLAALWIGYVLVLVPIAVWLVTIGAPGPDLPGVAGVLDAVLGGALGDPDLSWWAALLALCALPAAFVAAIVVVLRAPAEITTRTLALLVIPFAIAVGLHSRYAETAVIDGIPRTLLLVVVIIALAAPARLDQWFGITPLVTIGLAALPLAADWASEMTSPGRGPRDVTSLVVGMLLIALASSRVSMRARTLVASVLAAGALLHVAIVLEAGRDPFAKRADGTFSTNQYTPVLRGKRHPMLVGMRLTQPRRLTLEALATEIPARSSCFVVGDLPALYDLLACTNPTRLDSLQHATVHERTSALAELRAHPPEFLLVTDLGVLEVMRLLAERYEAVRIAIAAPPMPDGFHTLRLYRRRP